MISLLWCGLFFAPVPVSDKSVCHLFPMKTYLNGYEVAVFKEERVTFYFSLILHPPFIFTHAHTSSSMKKNKDKCNYFQCSTIPLSDYLAYKTSILSSIFFKQSGAC